MNTADHCQQIVRDLDRLAVSNVSVFGSDNHRFRLNPPLRLSEIEEFERQHSIQLPEDYRSFLHLVGRGGAGPYYGLFDFHQMDGIRDPQMPWRAGNGFVGNLHLPFPHTDDWNDLTEEPDEKLMDEDGDEYDRLLDLFEKKYWGPLDGAIPICHRGCALRQWLVVSGPEAGNIWDDDRADHNGLSPLSKKGYDRITFLQWYRDWLDGALAKLR
jgi:hypothetical protein